ncbi:MAG: sulfatase-like hydrolase/transferase [Candidatus Eisenbacteria bacterium]
MRSRPDSYAGRVHPPALRFWVLLAGPLALLLASCSSESGPPNVLLVTFDTTRADRIGCYGYASAHTPHLDELARNGALFEDALTAVPVTLPAHTTMMTGQYPLRHGVRNNGSYAVAPSTVTLAETLADAGYQTAAFVSAFVLDAQFGIAQGFQTYDDDLYNERPGPRTTERALEWLAKRDGRPFFLWVHLFDPHTPWTPAAFGRGLSLPDDYDREIAVADDCLGKLIAALGTERNNTVIAVVGDHGEGLDDHGEAEHGIFLYRETTRVPFVLSGPGLPMDGARLAAPVATVDLLPTLLELVAVPLPPGPLDGSSLVSFASGGPAPDRRGVYMETLYPRENFGWADLRAFQSDDQKWIEAPDPELYDIASDPAESVNLVTRDPSAATTMSDRLARFLAVVGEPAPKADEPVSPEVAERLRSLGYLAGGAAPIADADLPDPKSMIGIHADFEDAKRAMDESRFRDAIPHFEAVLAGNPENSTARLGLGTALVRVARYDEAEKVLGEAIEVHPGNTTVAAGLADAFFGKLDFATALSLYELASRDPSLGSRHVPSRIVLCLERSGRHGEADRFLESERAKSPEPKFWDDFRGRIAKDRELTPSIPPDGDPSRFGDEERTRRALTSAGLGIVTETLRWLTPPMADPAADLRRLGFLVQLYGETRQPERALEVLAQIDERAVLSPQQRQMRAQFLLELGRGREALATFVSLEGELPPVVWSLGMAKCQAAAGDPAAAVRSVRAAAHAGWSDTETLYTDPAFHELRGYAPFADLADSLTARRGS